MKLNTELNFEHGSVFFFLPVRIWELTQDSYMGERSLCFTSSVLVCSVSFPLLLRLLTPFPLSLQFMSDFEDKTEYLWEYK
jgi:hypothetical protein